MNAPTDAPNACLVCHSTADQVPLIQFHYRDAFRWICSQHLPVLIHNPQALAGLMPGAEELEPAEHED